MCYDNYQAGYYCQYCGTFIPYGTYHYCLNNWTTPITQTGNIVPIRNYKCPKCKGEFNESAYRRIRLKDSTGTYGKYVCPFCGKEMKGLNQ